MFITASGLVQFLHPSKVAPRQSHWPAITLLGRRREAGPSWALEWIGALWAPAPGESAALGPLLFKLGEDPQLRTADLLPVGEAPGRRLLYEASSRPPCGGG